MPADLSPQVCGANQAGLGSCPVQRAESRGADEIGKRPNGTETHHDFVLDKRDSPCKDALGPIPTPGRRVGESWRSAAVAARQRFAVRAAGGLCSHGLG